MIRVIGAIGDRGHIGATSGRGFMEGKKSQREFSRYGMAFSSVPSLKFVMSS